jgi:hypothetical protein
MNKKMRTAYTGRGFAAASLAVMALCLCGAPEVRAQWAQPTPADNTVSTSLSDEGSGRVSSGCVGRAARVSAATLCRLG